VESVSPLMALLLERLAQSPAMVVSRDGVVLARTRAGAALFGGGPAAPGRCGGDPAPSPTAGPDLPIVRLVRTYYARSHHRHHALGVLSLDCDFFVDPSAHQLLLLFSAPAGSPTAGKLRALSDIGHTTRHLPHSPLKARSPMKAIRFHEYGDPSVLRYEDADVPEPGHGQVRVRVAGTSFNGVDANIRKGLMQGPMPLTLPHTPGLDVAGTVESVGDGVDGLAEGDQVVGFLPFVVDGASAEFVLAPAESLAAAPHRLPLADAAGLPLVGLTAYQALFDHAGLTSGQRILISGAGGPVGGYAVQLAKSAGAYVVATASPQSSDLVRAQGADEVIDHTRTDVLDAVTDPVDVLLNLAPIEPAQYDALTGRVRDGGVVVGTTVWMPTPSDESRGVRGIDLYVRADAAQLSELVGRVDRGELTVDIARRVRLEELPEVHAAAVAGSLHGKVVVAVDPI
jgi:NADPH:quinone reductase-like Zn-dependent oxidoreductase